MELNTPRLLIREFCLPDLEDLLKLELDPATYHFEPATPSVQEVSLRLQKVLLEPAEEPRQRFHLAISRKPDPALIGRISLRLQSESINEWEIGWAVCPDHWRQGIASEAAAAMLAFAFNELHAHRVVAFCHAMNVGSFRVMQKIGMQQEGLLRETRLCRGQWSDEYVYAILDRDWHQKTAIHGS